MPPKRRGTTSASNKENCTPSQHNSLSNSLTESKPASSVDERPLCRYDLQCYRKNPQHFLEFRHTKKPSDTKSEESKSERTTSTNIESKSERRASSTNVESKSEKRATSRNTKTKSSRKEKREEGDERERMEVEGYRNLLKFGIVNNSISEAHKLYGLLSTKEPLTHSRLLAEFRTEHKITPSEHKRALSALHWTTTDYERGYHVPVLL